MAEALSNRLLWTYMQFLRFTRWGRFRNTLRSPWATQQRLLFDILARNRDTEFGRRHRFGQIESYEDFVEAVPVQNYESLRPYIEKQAHSRVNALNAQQPVMYAQTSGTTGIPKLIPVLEDTLDNFKRSQSVHVYMQFVAEPKAYRGKLLFITSPAVEGYLDSGIPYGSTSGNILEPLPKPVRDKFLLPEEVFTIEDYDLKYLTILRLALPHRDITSMGTANPSTFLKLHSVLHDRRQLLMEDIDQQTFRYSNRLPADVRAAIAPRLACTEDRVQELRLVLGNPDPAFVDLWPNLRLLTTWTGGSCGIALGALEKLLPSETRIAELGYLSSEFRGTIIVDLARNLGVPTIHENFFEFVERDAWDLGRPVFRTIEQIQKAKEYYIVVTTGAGLYRYFMNDIVAVTGSFESTPTIEFLRKGKGVTSITGEKLYENQVVQAVKSASDELNTAFEFFIMLADARQSVYRLVVECSSIPALPPARIRESVERNLDKLNVEYAQKRASGRLHDLELIMVKRGTSDAYKQDCLRRGQREGQFKTLILQYQEECPFSFRDYQLDSSA